MRAWKVLDAGRPSAGFKSLMAAARLGDVASQQMVGYLYDVGRGVRRSRTKAFYWYRRAARRSDPCAASNIGILYKEPGSFRLARFWLKRSNGLGLTDALLDLAKLEHAQGNDRLAVGYCESSSSAATRPSTPKSRREPCWPDSQPLCAVAPRNEVLANPVREHLFDLRESYLDCVDSVTFV